MDSMLGCDIRLVFTFPPKDRTLQNKKFVHLWKNFPCISTSNKVLLCIIIKIDNSTIFLLFTLTMTINLTQLHTVITRKQWNRKTTLKEYLSVFHVVTQQIVLLDTYQITNLLKWVDVYSTQMLCLLCSLYFLKL